MVINWLVIEKGLHVSGTLVVVHTLYGLGALIIPRGLRPIILVDISLNTMS